MSEERGNKFEGRGRRVTNACYFCINGKFRTLSKKIRFEKNAGRKGIQMKLKPLGLAARNRSAGLGRGEIKCNVKPTYKEKKEQTQKTKGMGKEKEEESKGFADKGKG